MLGSLPHLWGVRNMNAFLMSRLCHHRRHLTMVYTSPCGLFDPSLPQKHLIVVSSDHHPACGQLVGSLVGSELCRLICFYMHIGSKKHAGHNAFTYYYEKLDLYLRNQITSLSYYLTPTKSSDGVNSLFIIIYIQVSSETIHSIVQ